MPQQFMHLLAAIIILHLLMITTNTAIASNQEKTEIALNCGANDEIGLLQYYPDNCEDQPLILPLTKDIIGCRCKMGYLQASFFNKTCVLQSECKCPQNQEWKSFNKNRQVIRCNELAGEATFRDLFQQSPYYFYGRGCTCKENFKLDKKGNCVAPKDCKGF